MTDSPNTPVSLQSLMIPSKEVELEMPGYEGLKVTVTYLARSELMKLRKKCVTSKWDKKTHKPEDVFDEDKFLALYTDAIIKTWSGFKYSYLEELLLVDLNDLDSDDEMPHTSDNAQTLMKNSSDFDSWISDAVGTLENFTKNK